MRSGLVRTEAIVLSRLKYSDSSNIISFYTKERGKISGLLKGARSIKSKSGLAVDILNIVEIFYYEKEGRELFTINSAELVFHPGSVLTDFTTLSCATSIIELLKELTVPHEVNERLYRGSDRILRLMDSPGEDPLTLLLRYFFFILDESGVGIHYESCAACGREIEGKDPVRFDSGYGILCENCAQEKRRGIKISMELYTFIHCLITGKKSDISNPGLSTDLLGILETYTRTHFETFKGLKALRILGDL